MDTSPCRLGLPRSRRIKQGRDFTRAKVHGHRLMHGCMILNWYLLPPGSVSRVGVITGRRLGAAVVRSRARRLLREAFRLHQSHLAHAVDLILVARPSIAGKRFAEVAADYRTALRRARLFQDTTPGNGRAVT